MTTEQTKRLEALREQVENEIAFISAKHEQGFACYDEMRWLLLLEVKFVVHLIDSGEFIPKEKVREAFLKFYCNDGRSGDYRTRKIATFLDISLEETE